MKYQMKPVTVTVEAVQFNGHNANEILAFGGGCVEEVGAQIRCNTPEGMLAVPIGHWVVRRDGGEYRSYSNDLFEKFYDVAKAEAAVEDEPKPEPKPEPKEKPATTRKKQ